MTLTGWLLTHRVIVLKTMKVSAS